MELDRLTPVEEALRRRRWIWRIAFLLIALLVLYILVVERTYTPEYASKEDHFKYGSIGSETASGLPYWVFKALPKLYEDEFRGRGYRRFGMVYESESADLPIGFSRRTVKGVERVWLNCAVCHVGTVKTTDQGERQFIYGAPSNNLRLYDFIQFLRRAAVDSRFTADRLVEAINSEDVGGDLGPVGRLFYRRVIFPRVREGLLRIRDQLSFMDRPDAQDWGPGRVDTFNPYKAIQFGFPMDAGHLPTVELNAASDYPSIWQQAPRQGLELHWDGNNPSVDERNLSAALGAGVTPPTVDHAGIRRVKDWMWTLEPPKYKKLTDRPIDPELSARGHGLFAAYCADCHGIGTDDGYDYSPQAHPRLGRVEALASIGTDRGRWASYTEAFAGAQNLLYAGYPVRFRNFRKTRGYANHPLDGIWARSPYLHNGSVPTLRDLLEPQSKRPARWYRGSEVFDFDRVGYRAGGLGESPTSLFEYDTTRPGNSNGGHEGAAYGTELSASDKDALVEYMKSL